MRARNLTAAAAVAASFACAMTAAQETSMHVPQGRDKKVEAMMKDMYTAFMLAKNMIGFFLMFVSPIMQIKGFGLSVINTLINLTRLFVQVQSAKLDHPGHKSVDYDHDHDHVHPHSGVNLFTLSGADDRLSAPVPYYAYYAPPPLRRPSVTSLPSSSYGALHVKNGSNPKRKTNFKRFR